MIPPMPFFPPGAPMMIPPNVSIHSCFAGYKKKCLCFR